MQKVASNFGFPVHWLKYNREFPRRPITSIRKVGDCRPAANVLLHVVEGKLHELEVYKDDNSAIEAALDALDMNRLHLLQGFDQRRACGRFSSIEGHPL